MKQIDMFVEAEDRRLLAGVKSVGFQFVVNRLPSTPWLTPADIATALPGNPKTDTVYRWIDAGAFEYIDIGSGRSGKRRCMIERSSFLRFLKGRINRI